MSRATITGRRSRRPAPVAWPHSTRNAGWRNKDIEERTKDGKDTMDSSQVHNDNGGLSVLAVLLVLDFARLTEVFHGTDVGGTSSSAGIYWQSGSLAGLDSHAARFE